MISDDSLDVTFCGEARPAAASAFGTDDARRYRTLIEQLPLVVYVDALDAASSNIFTSEQINGMVPDYVKCLTDCQGK